MSEGSAHSVIDTILALNEINGGYSKYIKEFMDVILDKPSQGELDEMALQSFYGDEVLDWSQDEKDLRIERWKSRYKKEKHPKAEGYPFELGGKGLVWDWDEKTQSGKWNYDEAKDISPDDWWKLVAKHEDKGESLDIRNIVRMNEINKLAGFPDVSFEGQKEDRSAVHYNPFLGIQLTEEALPSSIKPHEVTKSLPKFGTQMLPEMAHALQETQQPFGEYFSETINMVPFLARAGLDLLGGKDTFSTAYEESYKTPGTKEWGAHGEGGIEPALWKYLESGTLPENVPTWLKEVIDEMYK